MTSAAVSPAPDVPQTLTRFLERCEKVVPEHAAHAAADAAKAAEAADRTEMANQAVIRLIGDTNPDGPFEHASVDELREALTRLQTLGAKMDVEAGTGPLGLRKTPFFWAIICERKDVVALMLQMPMDINAPSEVYRYTPLMAAAQLSNTEILDMILKSDKKPDLNARDSDGTTAFAHAVRIENMDAVRTLGKAGADPFVKDRWAKAALRHVESREMKNLIREIQKEHRRQHPKTPVMRRRFLGLAGMGRGD